ncbi:uncharacterized protein LOC123676837 isoform X3 [Harmonia axyridis]|uniref:uncharacterized protein LOC123676837 isoform X3 n=1 Tax=Harmonia axyridis TaxID=115357 RepID=UPI001E275FA8|nr:uncharacterized protein LOC123676837 isoform X3 [Harmonia axyridis]
MSSHNEEILSYEYVLKYILWIKKIAIFDFTLAKSYKISWFFILLWKLFLTFLQFYLYIIVLPKLDSLHLRVMERYCHYAINLLNLVVCSVLIFFDSGINSGNTILSRFDLRADKIFLKMRRCILIEYLLEEIIMLWKIIIVFFFFALKFDLSMTLQTILFMYSDIIFNLTITEFSGSLITLAVYACKFHENFRNSSHFDDSISYYIDSCKDICSSGRKIFENFSNVIIIVIFHYFMILTYISLNVKVTILKGTNRDGDLKYYWAFLSSLRVCKIILGCSLHSFAINQMMDFLKSSITKMSDKDRKQVKFFLLERLHEPSILEIKKCLQFDGGLLYSAIGAITTYAVILFQLDELQTS